MTATNDAGSAIAASSSLTVPVPASPAASAPFNTAAPALSGATTLGATLSCSPGNWTGIPAPTFAYQWLRDGAAIGGTSGTSYVVQSADCGHDLLPGDGHKRRRLPAASKAVTIEPPPALTLKASSPRKVTPGRRVTIRGTVTDFSAPATTVSICRRLSGKLTVLKRLTISASGAFHWKMKAGKPGKSCWSRPTALPGSASRARPSR